MEISELILRSMVALISLGALVTSIVALCKERTRSNDRKMRDALIDELSKFIIEFRHFLHPLLEEKTSFVPQTFISNMKYHSMRLSAIKEVMTEVMGEEFKEVVNIVEEFTSINRTITDSQEFVHAKANGGKVILQDVTILQTEQMYSVLYKHVLRTQHRINSSVSKPKKK